MKNAYWKTQPIIVRPDGSYIIRVETPGGDAPYHVPCEGEFLPLFAEVDAWARAHPGQVSQEPEPVVEPPTPERILASFTAAIQRHLDAFAQTRNYDGILSAATYATSTVPKFAAEGQYAVEARDATWARAYEILAQVESGSRPMPSIEEVVAELPSLTWPEQAEPVEA